MVGCYHYLFDAAIKLRHMGLDWLSPNHGPLQYDQGTNRKKAHSDIDISKSLGVDKPSEVLFVTDIYEEAVAAKNAGLSLSSLEMHLFQNIMGSNSAFIHGDLMIESGLVVQTPTWINGLSILILFCSYVGLWIRCVVYLFFCNHYS
ncbi:hypothetical protein EUGRSUZ_F03309 [Eucalyptus grandis]|uniref:Uncharacterized protein n=2 Tax=Eucalyptus grandis TaxID=71139 RepID=A0A059BVK3_EUCGR|nr:hypothetical protein EUGRSUZ_F03309 [Eucalyptus grandis]